MCIRDRPPEVPCLNAAVGKGAQHLELVVVADLLHMGKLLTAEMCIRDRAIIELV